MAHRHGLAEVHFFLYRPFSSWLEGGRGQGSPLLCKSPFIERERLRAGGGGGGVREGGSRLGPLTPRSKRVRVCGVSMRAQAWLWYALVWH